MKKRALMVEGRGMQDGDRKARHLCSDLCAIIILYKK